MLRSRAGEHIKPDDLDEIFKESSRKRRRWWLSVKLGQLMRNKLVITLSYLISFILIRHYLKTRSQEPELESPREDIGAADIGLELGLYSDSIANHFEPFPYNADAILLPNAPFKHVHHHLDIRTVQLVYLDLIRQKLVKARQKSDNKPPSFDFNWPDWVDMSDLDILFNEKPTCFVAGVLGSNVRTEWNDCIDSKDKKSLSIRFDRLAQVPESQYRLLLRAKTYLYSTAPIPNKLIFLIGEMSFVVRIKKRAGIVESGMVDDFIRVRLNDHVTPDDVKRSPILSETIFDSICEEIGRDLRDFTTSPSQYVDVSLSDFDTIIKRVRKSKTALEAATYGWYHFHDSIVEGPNYDYQASYDWRFFKKVLDLKRHRAALHHTVRAWLSLTNNLGITTWLDEDSLVSWSFNGMILPWEDTVNFKLPASDFQKLITYNYSLIVEDPLVGSGAYLLDITPNFLERARLNDPTESPDTIDARFIDIKTGVYLELNGLMFSDAEVPADLVREHGEQTGSDYVNAADGKFYHLTDLLPIKRTLFEGNLANVPGNALKLILHSNIHAMESKEFENYKYQDHLRLWIDKSQCNYVPLEDIKIYKNGGSSFIGACHDLDIWAEYNLTQEITKFRQKEINANTQLSIGLRDQLKPLYPDYWLLDRMEVLNKEFGYSLPKE